MRTHKAHFLAAVLLLAACSSETSKGTITPGDTTIPPGSTAPGTSGGAVDTTLPDVWVQPAETATLFFMESRGTYEAPDFVVSMLTLDGTRTDLWTENTGNGVTLLDASADRSTLLLRHYEYDANSGQSTETLSERDLASGRETVVTSMSESFNARYVQDGTGDILLKHDVDHADNTGVITSTTEMLDRIGPDGALVVNIVTRETTDGGGSSFGWLQASVDGQPAIVVGGTPMMVIGPGGEQRGALGNDRSCQPVRQAGSGAIIASCGDVTEYITQLWLVPLDGSSPRQITFADVDPSGIDFGVWDVWTTADGRQWVQRGGDCGAVWVEELQADGTTTDAEATGLIIGVSGTQLLTATNGMCEGGMTTISAYDSATGTSTDLLVPSSDDPDVMGVNAFEILALPR